MKRPLASVLAGLLLPAFAVAGLVTAPSAGAAEVRVLAYVADKNGDDHYGIYRSSVTGAGAVAIVPESTAYDVFTAKLSPSGRRIAFTKAVGAGGYDLHVMDINGSNDRIVVPTTATATAVTGISGFSWTRNDAQIAYGLRVDTDTTTSFSLGLVQVIGPLVRSTIPGSAGLSDPAIRPDGRLLAAVDTVASAAGTGRIVAISPTSGGRVTWASATGRDLISPTWSLDGSRLAWSSQSYSSTGAPAGSTITVRRSSDGALTSYGNSSLVNARPFFSPDGGLLYYDRYSPTSTSRFSDIVVESVATRARSSVTATATVDEYAASVADVDTTDPGAPVTLPFTPAGTTAVLRWVRPANPDVAGSVVFRRAGTGPFSVIYSGAGTAITDRGLTVGTTYTYRIAVYDGAGNVGAPVDRLMVALSSPLLRAPNPTSSVSVGAQFPVSWATPGNPASTRYEVRYLYRTPPSWAPVPSVVWRNTTATSAVFGPAAPRRVSVGDTYYFFARATDPYGNSTAYSPTATAAVPYNDSSASYSAGWAVSTSSARTFGTAHATRTNGAYGGVVTAARQFQLIGDRCGGCGSLRVYVDGVLHATVSTRGTAAVRQVLWTSRSLGTTVATHRLLFVAQVGTGQIVWIDGITALR